MRLIVFTLLSCLALLGCKPKQYVQVFETQGENTTDESGFHTFENDTVKITYVFNNEKGGMAFSIQNKLRRPIYIDWSKSTFEGITGKYSYGNFNPKKKDEINYQYKGYNVIALDRLKQGIFAVRKINFENPVKIMPDSIYENVKFHILPVEFFPLGREVKAEEVSSHEFPDQKVKTYTQEFDLNNSPVHFKNVFTFYLSPNFREEFQVKSQFYVSKIEEMPYTQLRHVSRDKNGKIFNKKHYKVYYNLPKQFYLTIDKKNSVEHRHRF